MVLRHDPSGTYVSAAVNGSAQRAQHVTDTRPLPYALAPSRARAPSALRPLRRPARPCFLPSSGYLSVIPSQLQSCVCAPSTTRGLNNADGDRTTCALSNPSHESIKRNVFARVLDTIEFGSRIITWLNHFF